MSRSGGEERRRQLVDRALESFAFRGYHATTLDEIAARAGVRKQTLLYYFASKEKLIQACVGEFGVHVGGVIEKALAAPLDRWGRVETVIRSVFRIAEKRRELVFFAREAARSSPRVVQRMANVLDPLRRRALDHLEEGMRAGVFCRQDPGMLLFMLYTAVVSSVAEAGVLRAVVGRTKEKTTLRQREEEVLEFVRRALCAGKLRARRSNR